MFPLIGIGVGMTSLSSRIGGEGRDIAAGVVTGLSLQRKLGALAILALLVPLPTTLIAFGDCEVNSKRWTIC